MSGPITPRDDVHSVFSAERARPDRLIHLIPDQLAAEVPEHPLFSFPKTARPQDGFVDISARQFANAINRTAWYLRELLGEPKNFESVGYMGPNDIRYFLFMFAAIKVGYKMCFTSPRNNLDGHLNVLKGVDCNVFLYGEGAGVQEILANRAMKTAVVPELTELLDEAPVPIYPYTKTFEEARHDPCLVLHTTGSTGLPKPITWKVAILSTYEAWRTVPHVDGYVPTTVVYQQARRAYTSMPLFHTSGLNAGITWSLLLGVTLVYSAPRVVPNASYTDEMHKYAGVDATMGAPSLYEELSSHPESLERLKNLKYVVASGAPLSQRAGALISQKSRVISNLGSTETACLQRLSPNIEDWDYFFWHPTHSGIEMREVLPNLFELFILRKPGLELYQGIFTTFPHIDEWSMSDLYERHPSKPYLFRYKCRRDDVIVLSNGEKIAPALMEATLNSSPLVQGAMIVGRGKFQPAALIDLGRAAPQTPKERHALVEQLLPYIKDANEHAPAHGQLDQYHILFADPARPVHYLGQGKIQRLRTYQLYEQDIERLYEAAENPDGDAVDHTPRLNFSSVGALAPGLAELISEISGIDVKGVPPTQDLFELGLDSLHVIRLARELRLEAVSTPGLEKTALRSLSPRVVYSHPTLVALASHLVDSIESDANADLARLRGYEASATGAEGNKIAIRTRPAVPGVERARAILGKYVQSLPRATRPPAPESSTGAKTVLLTGSTGSLGSYLLDALVRDRGVAKVICLNRVDNAAERHAQTAAQRGLVVPAADRAEFLRADLSKAYLGLTEATYNRLRQSVTHIIHNQWPVNFNWSITSFDPYIRGVRNLAVLSSRSTHNAFLLFVSSVSSVSSWTAPGGVPEDVVQEIETAAPIGYGQSKLVAENLLNRAASISGVRSACCRVGIVAGPVGSRHKGGLWNKHEYIPSVVISSAHLGVFPATFPARDRVDWLPVDKVASVLLEILDAASAPSSSAEEETKIFHVVNPITASWKDEIATAVLSAYPPSLGPVRPVPFAEWVEALRKSSAGDNVDVDANPAVRLVDFYEGLVEAGEGGEPRRLTSKRAEAVSTSLRNAGPVNEEWLKTWMVQWGLKVEPDWLRLN